MGAKQFESIFFPGLARSNDYLAAHPEQKFAYYTDVETLFKIAQNKCIWLRDTRLMNDASEVLYAKDKIFTMISREDFKAKLVEVLKIIQPDLTAKEAIEYYEKLLERFEAFFIKHSIHIACLTEHHEGDLGRLSMWRAYGRSSVNVALVFNNPGKVNGLLRVDYISESDMESHFSSQIDAIYTGIKNFDYGTLLSDRWVLLKTALECLFVAAISTPTFIKHPGFKEEKEWRIINYDVKEHDVSECKILNGMPQKIIEFRLDKDASIGNTSLDVLLDHIIIGPCEQPMLAKEAILLQLKRFGLHLRDDQVRISGIPLRSS